MAELEDSKIGSGQWRALVGDLFSIRNEKDSVRSREASYLLIEKIYKFSQRTVDTIRFDLLL